MLYMHLSLTPIKGDIYRCKPCLLLVHSDVMFRTTSTKGSLQMCTVNSLSSFLYQARDHYSRISTLLNVSSRIFSMASSVLSLVFFSSSIFQRNFPNISSNIFISVFSISSRTCFSVVARRFASAASLHVDHFVVTG